MAVEVAGGTGRSLRESAEAVREAAEADRAKAQGDQLIAEEARDQALEWLRTAEKDLKEVVSELEQAKEERGRVGERLKLGAWAL